jgi:hypothetical protein
LHPQAIIVDASSTEELYFLEAIRTKAKEVNIPTINLPANSQKQLAYMTKLDSSSLSGKHELSGALLNRANSTTQPGMTFTWTSSYTLLLVPLGA